LKFQRCVPATAAAWLLTSQQKRIAFALGASEAKTFAVKTDKDGIAHITNLAPATTG
jgi:hypothetical protein